MLFNIHINDLDAELEGVLRKFAVCSELGGAVKCLRGREGLQRNLDKSEIWAITNHGKLNKGSAGFCIWEGANLDVWVDWGMRLRAAAGRDSGVLVHGKLNMSHQCPGSQDVSWGIR